MAATRNRFISIDLEEKKILSTHQFAGHLGYLPLNTLSVSFGRKDYLFSMSSATNIIKNQKRCILVNELDGDGIRLKDQIDFSRMFKKYFEIRIYDIVSIELDEESKRVLLLVQAFVPQGAPSLGIPAGRSFAHVEYSLENPLDIKADLIPIM